MTDRPTFKASGYQKAGRRPGMPLPEKPWQPAPYDDADVSAMKALRHGNATPEQQQRGLAWILECAARTYANPFVNGGREAERDTTFGTGCKHVGDQILALINAQTKHINEEQGR